MYYIPMFKCREQFTFKYKSLVSLPLAPLRQSEMRLGKLTRLEWLKLPYAYLLNQEKKIKCKLTH